MTYLLATLILRFAVVLPKGKIKSREQALYLLS